MTRHGSPLSLSLMSTPISFYFADLQWPDERGDPWKQHVHLSLSLSLRFQSYSSPYSIPLTIFYFPRLLVYHVCANI